MVALFLPFFPTQNAAGAAPAKEQAAGDTLRVVSWNLEWFPGRKPEAPRAERDAQMRDARAALDEIRPQVLLLQEVADWKSVQELVSGLPGMRVHVVSQFHERPQNLAIASTLPLDSAWYELWKDAPPHTPPRGFAFAALQLPGNRFLLVYTVHYKSNHGKPEENFAMREQATRQLLEHAAGMMEIYGRRGECFLMIGGDFNTSVDDPQFAEDSSVTALKEAGMRWVHANVPLENRITWPAMGPFLDTCFDHLLSLGVELESARVPSLPQISDHNPIVADYRVPQESGLRLSLDHLDRVAPSAAELQEKFGSPVFQPSAAARGALLGAIHAVETERLRGMEGKPARVYGVVRRVGQSPSGHIVFINFGSQRGDFTAIVRSGNLPSVSKIVPGKDLADGLPGRTIEVRGTIELFKGNPQIEVKEARQLRML